MKKIIATVLLLCIVITSSGCFKKDDLEGANIYTTVYPIGYITERLYGENSTIHSMYPDDINPDDYSLSNEQINEYSKSDIFIYNGLSNEKQIAKTFLNKNKKLKIIDVAYGLKINNKNEELWLSPSNFLMISSNVKKNLIEFIENKYLIEEIEKNYNELEEEMSIMDAELRNIASSAKQNGNNTLIVSSNLFKFLNDYGFNIISLEDEENLTNNNLNNIKSKFKNKEYTSILIDSSVAETELITNLKNNYDANLISVNTMNTLKKENIENGDNYISIMNDFIENIRNITLG